MHDFDSNLEFGNRVSARVRAELVQDGWTVIALEDLPAGMYRGPHTDGPEDDDVPDYQISKFGRTLLLEVKAKREVGYNRNYGLFEHCINQSSYEDYQRVERNLGFPVFLLVVTVGLRGDEWHPLIAKLSSLGVHPANIYNTACVFFPITQMHADWLQHLNRHIQRQEWERARSERHR